MRKENLETLLDSIYELEGLVHLAISRDDEPAMLPELIRRKSRELLEHATRATGEVISDLDKGVTAEKVVAETEVISEQPIIEDIPLADIPVIESELTVTTTEPAIAEPVIPAITKPVVEVSEPISEEVAAEIDESVPVVKEAEKTVEEVFQEVMPERPTVVQEVKVADPEQKVVVPEVKVVLPEVKVVVPEVKVVVSERDDITVSGKVTDSRQKVSDLKQSISAFREEMQVDKGEKETYKFDDFSEPRGRLVFSINDRYRFRRELFNGSDVDFNTTLSLVASMDDYEEAQDYFLDELQWDEKSPDVIDFLEILKNYFK
ncbi:MAG: hypothetical protein K2K95_08165 [Muribaculaceae bacterium]|nr:hypothetical protein [Muribaculaceae bacterium]